MHDLIVICLRRLRVAAMAKQGLLQAGNLVLGFFQYEFQIQ